MVRSRRLMMELDRWVRVCGGNYGLDGIVIVNCINTKPRREIGFGPSRQHCQRIFELYHLVN